jgi:hypothetical protein
MAHPRVCIAGWSQDLNRMVRPLLQTGGPHWLVALAQAGLLRVGNILTFNPTGTPHNRGMPHETEDWVVNGQPTMVGALTPARTRAALAGSVSPSMDTLFRHLLQNRKFVPEGARCPSLGAIEIDPNHLDFTDAGKLRCEFHDPSGYFDFPVTSKELRDLHQARGLNAVKGLKQGATIAHIRIGLANAWAGSSFTFNPRRCYAQVNGIIFI